ncbi:hypothetical protein [Thalassomonas haliotis]|uniref:Uncharacterized protein n=1 Tax=Thalassomonas haliotis TaxID=485448 RepID=A0ABY7VK71_9GAMM|nr:hypothetical protein [Thalassomonas haliotis]WDE13848.1 hypothetical protein H3N35_10640 [Thalassomonas haliotis]
MKVNKSSGNCPVYTGASKVFPDKYSDKSYDCQLWLAKIADKLGLCCVGLHK